MAYSPPNATSDPTKVMGRRYAAWLIDFIPAVVLVAIFSRRKAVTYTNVPARFCDTFRATHNGYICFQGGSTAYTNSGLRGGAIVIWLAYYFIVAGLLQGATGATFGKHMVGLRVIDKEGNLLNMGQALLRTLIGVFEIGFCFVIALVSSLVSHPHRRLGDFAAGTFVVAKESVGTPVMGGDGSGYPPAWTPPPQGAWTPPPGQQPWGAPPSTSPPATQGPAAWGTPGAIPPPAQSPTTWGTPAASPAPAAWGTPTEPQPAATDPATNVPSSTAPSSDAPSTDAPSTDAPSSSAPVSDAPVSDAPGWGSPAASQPAAQPAPQPPAREPQWDAQRNAWVFWEAETNRWLQHDPATGQWGPLR